MKRFEGLNAFLPSQHGALCCITNSGFFTKDPILTLLALILVSTNVWGKDTFSSFLPHISSEITNEVSSVKASNTAVPRGCEEDKLLAGASPFISCWNCLCYTNCPSITSSTSAACRFLEEAFDNTGYCVFLSRVFIIREKGFFFFLNEKCAWKRTFARRKPRSGLGRNEWTESSNITIEGTELVPGNKKALQG